MLEPAAELRRPDFSSVFIPLHTAFLTGSETGIMFVDRFKGNM